jgi:hypothetical protein
VKGKNKAKESVPSVSKKRFTKDLRLSDDQKDKIRGGSSLQQAG